MICHMQRREDLLRKKPFKLIEFPKLAVLQEIVEEQKQAAKSGQDQAAAGALFIQAALNGQGRQCGGKKQRQEQEPRTDAFTVE